jgi:hypothetical protein
LKPGALGVAVILSATAPHLASAQEANGLSLMFERGSHDFVPLMDGARTGFTRFLTLDAVSIEGVAGPARLVVELSLPPGARSGDQPHDARISFRPDGWRDYWVTPPDLPAGAVILDHIDLSGSEPRIAGWFAAPLCLTRSPVHTPDPERCLPASGRFATPLARD